MKYFEYILAAFLLVLTATKVFADPPYGTWNDPPGAGSQINNNQLSQQNSWSNLHVTVDTIGGDVAAQGAAAGNPIDITTMNNTTVTNNQVVNGGATIGSNISLDANKVWGSVGVQNQVICNGASVSTDPILTSVQSNQECHAVDPYSQINANITNLAGNAVIQGSALGNSFEADSNAPNMPIM